MTDSAPVSGGCHPALTVVQDAFEANFTERGEVGAAVCVIVDGETVVDLVGGWTDAARTTEWRPDTLVNFYSVGKAIVGLLVLRAVDAGRITLDTAVAELWPEFAQHGKTDITVRHALCHLAGVPALRERLSDDDLFDWDTMCAAVAGTPPWSAAGERLIYHTNTYGHLVGGIAHRATGQLPGTLLREIAAPIGADLWFGLPREEQTRCAEVIWAPSADVTGPLDRLDPFAVEHSGLSDEARMVLLGYFNPPGYSSQGVVNTVAWRSCQVPSTNGHGTAEGLARLYAALITPDALLSPELLAEATRPQVSGHCPVLGEDITFGLGFVPTSARRPLGTGSRSFGHFGTGGALGFADPERRLAFGYTMNHVIPRWQSSRNRALVDALYRVIDNL